MPVAVAQLAGAVKVVVKGPQLLKVYPLVVVILGMIATKCLSERRKKNRDDKEEIARVKKSFENYQEAKCRYETGSQAD